MHPRWFRGGVE